jgi:hypothetical protein
MQEQVLLLARGRRQLYLLRRHPLLPPPTPLQGMPIDSMLVTHHSHHGSSHDKSNVLVMFADVMAHGLPIHRSTFSAGGNISPVLPTNLLLMAGIRWGGGDSVSSCSFGGTFLETIFLAEGFPSFRLPFFGSFSVDCWIVHGFLLHLLPRLSFGSFCPSSCFVHFHFGYAI